MVKTVINALIHNPKVAISIIILSTILVYSNTFKNNFVVDDYLFIVDWPLIQDLGNWPQFFGSQSQPKGEEGVYSPLKTFVHSLNYHLWGTNPFGYHLCALAIHLLGTALIYRISHLLTANYFIAFLSGILFGLHPIHVEAITFLTASIDTLGIVFLFLSFYFYIPKQNKDHIGTASYLCSLFFALLAIFTHELAIILPVLFLFYDLCLNSKSSSRSKIFLRLFPYFIFSVFYIGLKWSLFGTITRGGYLFGSFYLTMLVIIKALARYVSILIFPFNLSFSPEISEGIYAVDWQYFDKEAVLSQSFFDPQVLLSLGLTGAIIYGALRLWKKNPLVSFCIGWFYISLLPVMNIVPSESYFAQRYLYPGSLGFCLGVAILFNALYDNHRNHRAGFLKYFGKWLSIFGIVVILVFYSTRTVLRNDDWRDELSFYKAEVLGNPGHPAMQRDLGTIYLRRSNFMEALKHLQISVALLPSNEDAHFALAEVYTALRDSSRAISSYKAAIDINAEFAEAYYNLGSIYAHLGDKEKAQKNLSRAVRLFERQGKIQKTKTAKKVFDVHFGSKER